jgi:hypothetical protein
VQKIGQPFWICVKATDLALDMIRKNNEYRDRHGRNESVGNMNADGLRSRVEACCKFAMVL